MRPAQVDAVINCSAQVMPVTPQGAYLQLPVPASKLDKGGLERVLGEALAFAGTHLAQGRRLAVVCE
eukprot:8690886-Pyramimonas_sp.AAC.1